ncbi:negative transcriptional regulator [Actibacterium mucosum KCTC 23349]|uniref:Negative transcriptional regulator n=1 Tax=Actibacterium mucosum KCTC 23349 TaxID=1454373 RepID=A0A037ZNJ3_9RHOB|nr:FMN-binding negative transcriptional regulator [Actibacterium mucosum]KAJ57113.1 negative transcriptional regulator [Actibacterium mucosum KCTC 23349]
MHPNPVFRKTPPDQNLQFADAQSFGCLSINGADGPMLAHVPFLLAEDGKSADLHLVRSNPIARAELPARGVIAVQGPHGYVSPDWYGIDDQVPTWNYVAVHLRGKLETRPGAEMPDLLTRLSAHFERDLAPKPEWKMDKMSGAALAKMMRMIVPLRLHIDSVDGTWKLNQNKDDAVRQAAINRVTEGRRGMELQRLAQLMRAALQ